MVEELVDVAGAIHMAFEYGIRYYGWYFFKTPLRKQVISLDYNHEKINYTFVACEYNYRFVMPVKIDFAGGMIAYSDAERKLGVFRFPRDEEGRFIAPLKFSKDSDFLMSMSEEEMKKILARKNPLVFDAYRIPQVCFEMFDVSDFNLKEIADFTNTSFSQEVKEFHDKVLKEKIEEVKLKIESYPNYLLILKDVLNLRRIDYEKVSEETDGIIHI